MDSVVIAPWGNPKRWKLACYIVEKPKDDYEKTNRKFKSTLGALLEVYRDAHGLVLASSTLASVESGGYPSSYRDVVERSKRYIEVFIKNKEYIASPERVSFEILPGIGVFTNNGLRWIFHGSPETYAIAAYYIVYRFLEEKRPRRVILDLSHGINYMPALAREAVSLAVATYSARHGREVEFLNYNSDPVNEENVEAYIHLVENRRISPSYAAGWISYRAISIGVNAIGVKTVAASEERKRRIGPKYGDFNTLFKNAAKSAKSALSVIDYGFVLYLAQCMHSDLERVSEYTAQFEKLLEDVLSGKEVVISRNEGGVLIDYSIGVKLEAAYLYAAAKMLELAGAPEDGGAFTLNTLKRIAEQYSYSPMMKYVAKHELSNIDKRARKYAKECGGLSEFTPYYIVYVSTKFRDGEVEVAKCNATLEQRVVDLRNFIAHGGLEENLVEVKVSGGEVFIRYSDCDKAREIVDKIIR